MYETITTELNEHLGQAWLCDETWLYVNAETCLSPINGTDEAGRNWQESWEKHL